VNSQEWQTFRNIANSADEREVRLMWDVLRARLDLLSTYQVYTFQIGDRVQFRDRRGYLHIGTVHKLNRKTVGVLVNGRKWRVGPSFLSLVLEESWQEVLGLGLEATYEQAHQAYRELARKHHPDNGGSVKEMQKINQAWAEALGHYGVEVSISLD